MVFSSGFAYVIPLYSVAITQLNTVSAGQGFFLGSRQQHLSAGGLLAGRGDLLRDLEQILGQEHRLATEQRVERLETAIEPIFSSMPTDVRGRLDSAGVRYLLHRHFVQRHGWIVKGLDTGGNSWNSSSPAAVFAGHADNHRNVFEATLAKEGFSLHQTAVFAATLEVLVHEENEARLRAAYRVLGFEDTTTELQDEEVDLVIRAFMLMFVQATNLTGVTAIEYARMSDEAVEMYPTWPDTERFAYNVRRVVGESVAEDKRRTWSTMLKVVEAIGERYGRWQDKECRDLKNLLVEMEDHGTGRVRLDKFYGSALTNQSWQFLESVPYLRQLGALDETDSQQLKIIIPNYINSPANCVASAGFYDVCCIDECEALMAKVELEIKAPDASPAQILGLVASLPSATIYAPRKISASSVDRLEEIASRHNGRVPLHGRLFAQWMHHAYPRECSFPHMSGTTRRLTQEDWIEQSSEPLVASAEEIKQLIAEASEAGRNSGEEVPSMPWSPEEELFVCRPDLPDKKVDQGTFTSRAFLCISGLVIAFVSSCRNGKHKAGIFLDNSPKNYFV